MKKKILIAVSVIICVIAIGLFILAGKSISPSVGLYLQTDNGNMLILDNSPISVSGNDDMFKKYESGDKILVFHDGILESYPAQTRAYFVMKLADGEMTDIPESVLTTLSELGWLTYEKESD